MKNAKNTKIILTLIMMICITLCTIWMIVDMTGEVTSWFLDSKDGKLCMDWKYAGPYFSLMVLALITWVTRTVLFTSKLGKDQSAKIVCEAIIGLGIVMAIIALFLPYGVDGDPALIWPYQLYDNPRMIACVIMSWFAMPMALVTSIARVSINALTK